MVTISGTPQQINTTFASANGLQYLSALNYNGPDNLIVTVSDAGQTGIPNPASPSTVTRTVTLTVNAMNDAPQVTVPGGQTVAEDASAYFGAIQVSDVDAGETAGATVRVTLTVDNGVLLVSTAVPGGLTGGNVSNNNSRSVVLTGTLAAMNKTLSTPPACSIGRRRISSAAIRSTSRSAIWATPASPGRRRRSARSRSP